MVVHGVDESSQVLKLASTGDSSPTSADNFRQIDDVFLQTQTRIWLGEVLRTRLNEQLSIADLLADGELLFEVSREVWKMMLSKHSELKPLRACEYESFASRNSGRYMPYSLVDSFLKMCKTLGLDGIDLFSPSDVVEKRDTRKVCICLRALSKKARFAHLNVPDFDIVTYTVAMPTDMVGYIRRSWELSHYDFSSSSSLSAHYKSRQRSRQEYLNKLSERNCDWSFKEFDDTESNSTLQFHSSATKPSYNSSCFKISSDSVNFSGVSSVSINEFLVHLDFESREKDSISQLEEVCSNKSKGSFFLHGTEYDHQQDNTASPSVLDANSQFSSGDLNAESGSENCYRSNAVDQVDVSPCMEDGISVVGNPSHCSTPKSNITDGQQAVSATMDNGTFAGNPILLDEKNSMYLACMGAGSCCSKTTVTVENEFTSQFLDRDDVELSSVGSTKSMSVRVQNLDFEDDLEIEDAIRNACFPGTKNGKFDGMSMKLTEGLKSEEIIEYKTSDRMLSTYNKTESPGMKGMDIGLSSPMSFVACLDKYTPGYLCHAMSNAKSIGMSQINLNVGDGKAKELFAAQSCFSHGFSQWDEKGKCQMAVAPIRDGGCGSLSLSPSLVDSTDENLQYVQIEVTGDALRHKKVKSIVADSDTCTTTMVKLDFVASKQPTRCSDNIINASQEDFNVSCNIAENRNKDEGRIQKLQISDIKQKDEHIRGTAENKPQKRHLLKAVVKGTAVVGAMFLLLQFRKNGREKSVESRSANGRDFSLGKGQRADRVDGVYPAEKLKLGQG